MKRASRDSNPGRPVEDHYFGEDPLQSFRRFVLPVRVDREPDPLLCRHLRSKAWPAVHPVVDPPDASEPFLCLKTLRRRGPDGGRVGPDSCTDERACCEPVHCSSDPES